MRVTSIAVTVALVAACSDRGRDSAGLPAAERWQAPAAANDATSHPALPAHELQRAALARCLARAFVDDAARDGNLPLDALDDWTPVTDGVAIEVLKALTVAASRLPAYDQQAMLLADIALRLVERGELDAARAAVSRVDTLVRRAARDSEKPGIAIDTAARVWGRLGDKAAMDRLLPDPVTAPPLLRGLVEGKHAALAEQARKAIASRAERDAYADGELVIAEFLELGYERTRETMASFPSEHRDVYAIRLAIAAVDAGHPRAADLVADAEKLLGSRPLPPGIRGDLARIHAQVGDAKAAARHRALLRVTADDTQGFEAHAALSRAHTFAVRAGADTEAAELRSALAARGAPVWLRVLASVDAASHAGDFERATEEILGQPADAKPPAGVGYLQIMGRYYARTPRDPAFEAWFVGRACPGDAPR